ncbi:hypothetical protein ZIOFF_003246 [Zingiber officinale]|uniref:Reverse transcriptase Ty1/copia-type domain-containing protein n=1 Tax=Zingiber officinale TaxID=94328 RepID=A0A8J5ICY9_ZINOF|nr:hypothetical protein ZIOFF_003246 [Zingiber officinale]
MSYKETVQDYYDHTIEIVNEIRALGGELPEEKVVEKATMSLPNKFEAKLPPEVEGVHEKTEVLLSAENLDLSNLAISRGASNLQAPSQGGYVQQNPLKKGGNEKEIYEPCPHYQEATKEQTTPSWPMTNEQVITPSAPEIVQNEDQGENGANSDLHDAESTPDQEATKEQITPSWPMTNEQVITPSAPEIVQNEDQGENGANSDLHDAESTPASGFTRSYADYSLYVKRSENQVLLVSVYVDDLLITANSPSLITSFKDSVMKEFQMIDLGLMTYFLGMEVHQKKGVGTFVGQTKYCMDLLHKYGMNEANPVVCPTDYKGAITSITGREKPDAAIYRGIVGSLIYLSHTRPDLSFLVSLLSRYMSQPTSAHLAAAKRALRYVKGTMDLGLFFPATGDNKNFTNLEGYSDSDYAGAENAKSTSGYIFYLNNAPFSWSTKKQDVVAQSTAEAEYIAAALARNQCTWIRQLLSDIGFTPEAATPLMIDNQAAIAIAKDPTHFSRAKHIKVRYHALHEAIKDKEIQLIHVPTENQKADMLTKVLRKTLFIHHRDRIGLKSLRFLNATKSGG